MDHFRRGKKSLFLICPKQKWNYESIFAALILLVMTRIIKHWCIICVYVHYLGMSKTINVNILQKSALCWTSYISFFRPCFFCPAALRVCDVNIYTCSSCFPAKENEYWPMCILGSWYPISESYWIIRLYSSWFLSYLRLPADCSYRWLSLCIAISFHAIYEFVCFMQLSSSNFFRSSGSTRRAAVSSSRDAVVVGSDTEHSRPLAMDASPGALRKISGAQRSPPITSSEHNRTSSSRKTSNIKNFESALKGIESLNFQWGDGTLLAAATLDQLSS